ncbi:MAG: hypothetical protein Q9227_008513 [Pyrenula ochraceoflavens]
MSVEVDRSGPPLSTLNPKIQSHTNLDNSTVLSAWLKQQLDGPSINSMPPEMPDYNFFAGEEIMGMYSAAPSPYDPMLGQTPLNDDFAHANIPNTNGQITYTSGGQWDGKYSDAALAGIEGNGRYISPQALTTRPGTFVTSGSTTTAPIPTYGLTVERTIYDNTRPNSAYNSPRPTSAYDNTRPNSAHVQNTQVGPFGYFNSLNSNHNITHAGLQHLARTATLSDFASSSIPMNYTSAPVTVVAPVFGNDPGFQQTTYHPPPSVARGTAAIERFQNQCVTYNVHAPGVAELIPQSPTLRRTKRDAEMAGLDTDEVAEKPKAATRNKITSAKKLKKAHTATSPASPNQSDPDPTPSPSEPPTPIRSSRKQKPKSHGTPDSAAPQSATTANAKAKKAVPKSAEERRQRHNESEKRRRDIFKGLRDKLFKSVPRSVDIESKTLGGKHKAVVRWVLELRKGNLALWEKAEAIGVDVEALELQCKNGKRELQRDPRLYFEMDENGGKGEDAASGLKRILETMGKIKGDRKDLVVADG